MIKVDFLDIALKEIDKRMHAFSRQQIQEQLKNYHSEFKSVDEYQAELEHETEEKILEFKKSFISGYHIVLEEEDNLFRKTGIHVQKMLDEDLSVDEKASQAMLLEAVKDQKPLQFAWGYNGKMMSAIYEIAMNFYTSKEYDKSLDVTQFLIGLNTYVCWFWQLLGRNYKAKQQFPYALFAFETALQLGEENLEAYQDIVKCLIANQEQPKALQFLNDEIDYLQKREDHDSFEELINDLKAMKAYLLKEMH